MLRGITMRDPSMTNEISMATDAPLKPPSFKVLPVMADRAELVVKKRERTAMLAVLNNSDRDLP